MFPSLPNNVHIYATTAADASHSSYGTYCTPDDSVDGTHLRTCLGDLYSVNRMEDADKATPGETARQRTAPCIDRECGCVLSATCAS